MTHFDSKVSVDTQNKIKVIAEQFKAWLEDGTSFKMEAISEASINTISGVPLSGFIPFQDGGYTVNQLFSNGIGSGYTFKITESLIDKMQKDCEADYLSENNLDTAPDNEKFYEYMDSYFDDYYPMIEFDVFIDDGIVTIRVSINHKDCPYYREQGADTLKSIEIPESELDTFVLTDWLSDIDW